MAEKPALIKRNSLLGHTRLTAFCLVLGCALGVQEAGAADAASVFNKAQQQVQAQPQDMAQQPQAQAGAQAQVLPQAGKRGGAANFARQQPWDAEHHGAVKVARDGDVESGLATLERLYAEHPDDIGVARDYVVVLGWAGKDKEAVKVYRGLGAGKHPDFVLEAAARSYRNLKNPKEALAIYREGLQREPNNLTFVAGEIRGMADVGESKKALARAEEDLKKRGDRVEVLLAAAYAAKVKKAPVESVRYCERAVRANPDSKAARHDLILAIADMGSPQVALSMADAHPEALSQAEYRRIEGDKAAAAVRWSPHEPSNEANRFVATDQTIAKLDKMINSWGKQGKAAQGDLNRARFDRMVAYRDRYRMQDVLDEHDRLKAEGVTIPPYAMAAVGDALLYKRKPRQARDVYQQVLAAQPNDFNTRLQLFYAYSELEDFDAAYKQIDGLAADQATWIHLKGLPEPLPNPTRESAELAAGYARVYAGDYVEANKRLGKMADSAPNNPRYRAALGTLYEERGWPRAAQEQFQVGKAVMQGKDKANEAGEARTNFELYRFKAAEAETRDLVARFPEDEEVQRLERMRKVHNKFELHVDVDHAFRSSTAASGGSGTGIDGVLYSPPIYNNWRLFAGQFFAEEEEPNAEGTLDFSRTMAGIEFRRNAVRLSVAPTYSRYDDVRTKNVERVGVRGEASWDISDRWNVSGHGEMFSRDTPLRAINSGITADGGNLNVTYRASERRRVRLDVDAMHFHDGNWHTGVAGEYVERLWTRPHFKIDGIVDLAESHNTLDRNRPYFNPKQDVLALGGLIANHTIYRRYDFEYGHSLTAKGGSYWQKDFGSDPAVLLRYEQVVQNDVLAAKVGATFTRQDFDGKVEDNVSLLLNLMYRF